MKTLGHNKYILPLLSSIAFLAVLFYITPLFAQESPPPSRPPRNIKGVMELDLSTQIGVRTVVEEINPGENFKGEAESTRILARVAIKPLRPVELYLQAGMANLIVDEFDDYRGDYDLAYGGGVAFTVYEAPRPRRFNVIMRGDTLHFTTSDNVLTNIGYVKEEIRWSEYNIDGIGIWRSQYWEPYAGARFSWLDSSDTIDDPSVGRLALEEDGNVAFVFGSNIYFDPRENFALNLEAILGDPISLTIGVKLWY